MLATLRAAHRGPVQPARRAAGAGACSYRIALHDHVSRRLGDARMDEILTALSNVAVLLFVVSSMLAMGTALTVPQITATLKNGKLVALALLANFVLVPLAALLITFIIPLEDSQKSAVIVLGCAAGAPFLPKLAQ